MLYTSWFLTLVLLQSDRDVAVALAIQTLASKLGISAHDVRTVDSVAMTWPDAGLGCAEGETARIATPGFRVLLMAPDSALYRVHVGAGRALVCGSPLALAPESPLPEEPPEMKQPPDPALAPLIEAARKDLARRLNVDLDAIEVIEAKSVVWPDGSLGCPKEGMVYPQVTVDGALVRLKHGVATYRYHSGGTRKPFLCEKPKPAGR